MRRPWQIWLILSACFTVAVCALGYLTHRALELDRDELAARQQAELEESVRLALWRMDTAAARILASESARPPGDYRPFPPPASTSGRIPRDALGASPLLTSPPPETVLHFELTETGQWSSPQVMDDERIPPVGTLVDEKQLAEREHRFAELQRTMGEAELWAMAPAPSAAAAPVVTVPEQNQVANTNVPQQQLPQRARGDNEFQARSQIVQNNSIANVERFNSSFTNAELQLTPMLPVWIGDRLILLRRATLRGQDRLQGCWLDWAVVKRQLLDQVEDLLPLAGLEPAPDSDEGSRLLATLPVELVLPPVAVAQPIGWSPTQLALLAAWMAMIMVSLALVLLMRGILALSERRAAFVSAVTHELRTPLTTFRMYTEMLLGGMVPAPSREKYLETLHAEADRLTHLVENVLAYARLEGGRGPLALEPVSIGDLIKTTEHRLAARATQADLKLVVDVDGEAARTTVHTNRLAVEQILFNLVDNACKYAKTDVNGSIRLSASASNGHAQLAVSDSGPGIGKSERSRLFQPFHKSAHEAADSAAGVGLGLALSRRLARQMGGELELRPSEGAGARFELTLPTVT